MKSRHLRLSLPFALPPGIKSAQISALPEFHSAEPFPRENWSRLAEFQPAVLIGYAYDLAKMTEAVENQTLPLSSVDRAIYTLTDCGMPVVDDALRQGLWRAFGVPVYELIVAPGCLLLAFECELHNGWHLQCGITPEISHGEIVYNTGRLQNVRTGYVGSIDSNRCECGRDTPLCRDLRPVVRSAKAPALSLAS